jgi:diguanylate cyclase (GGDEF)-like protein/PAS domain S-box-containing protein
MVPSGANEVTAIVRDVTERKKIEENLRKREQEFKTLVEHTPDVIIRFDREYRHIYVNPAVEKEFGLVPQDILGKTHRELGQTHELAYWSESIIRQVFQTGREIVFELSTPTPEGVQHYLSRGVPEFAEDGSVDSTLFIHHNITDRKRMEDQLREAEANYRNIFENAIDGIFQSTPEGRFVSVNEAMARIYGYDSPEEMIATIGNRIPTQLYADPQRRQEFVRIMDESGIVKEFEAENLRKDGSAIWIRTNARVIRDEQGNVRYYEGFLEDITERKQAEAELHQAEVKYRTVADFTYDWESWEAPDGGSQYVSPACERISGYPAAQFLADPSFLYNLIVEEDRPIFAEHRHTVNQTRAPQIIQFRIQHKNGETIWIEHACRPVVDDQGVFLGYRASNRDITQRRQSQQDLQDANKRLERQLEEIKLLQDNLRDQATRDALTGLFNRRHLYETMDRELARAKRESYSVSVMMIDIDHFKDFNDTYGHQAGDEALIALGNLLRNSIRQGDFACRYGGEEFFVLMPNVDMTSAERRAETICRDFNNLRVHYDGAELSATISIGLAFYPGSASDTNRLIKIADMSMYIAKQSGRNRVHVWRQD